MKLLFKREQSGGTVGQATFQLWTKVELDEDEAEIVKRYRFDNAILIAAIQPTLLRNAILIGAGVFLVLLGLLLPSMGGTGAPLIAIVAAGAAGYFYFNQKRETIYVRDLIYGRYFSCPSVVELARKEAWLSIITSFLRQVMESAKHWDGTEALDVEALPKDEAKLVIIKGLKEV